MRNPAQNIIHPSPAQRTVVARNNFNAADIIRLMLYADTRSEEFIDSARLHELKGSTQYHTLCNIYNFVKSRVRYEADPLEREWVRSPGYLIQSGAGDCKSLSLAIGALCRAFGIPFKYRFIRQASKSNWHHVYVVAMPTDGSCRRPVVLDAVHHSFDSEPRYINRRDKRPADQPAIAGLKMESGAILVVLLTLWLLFAQPTSRKRNSA